MASNQEHLKQLAALFKAAQTPAEREILLQGVRLISAKDYEALEDVLLRNQVREMSLPGIVALVAEQRNIPSERAEEMVRDMILENLLDRAKLRLHAGVPSEFPTTLTDVPTAVRPAVLILKETEQPHQYPPPDVEQRGQLAAPKDKGGRPLGEQATGGGLMPKGVG